MNPVEEPVLILEGGSEHIRVPLIGRTITAGRQSANDLVVAEAGVSRKHAEVFEGEDGFYLRDLGSTNGTQVNGKKIPVEPYLLSDGDQIKFGASETPVTFRSPTANTLQITLVDTVVEPDDEIDKTWIGEAVSAPMDVPTLDSDSSAGQADRHGIDEIYQGTVRLNVKAKGMGTVVHFTQALDDRPEFRILRLANNDVGGVEIVVGLRQPVPLRQMLLEMNGVADVSLTEGRDLSMSGVDSPLTVTLDVPSD